MRIEYMETNKKKMLNSILNRDIKKINIDRLIVNKDGNEDLLLDETEILEETNRHFKSITDSILERDENLESFWKDEYKPRNDINLDIYKNLLNISADLRNWLKLRIYKI